MKCLFDITNIAPFSGGKHHMVDQKPPDLPPSYRLDMASSAHMMMLGGGGGQQQDYVDMDGVLMNGGGPTPPPPIPQMYPTMSAASGNFFGSRGDDLNGMDDICKVHSTKCIYVTRLKTALYCTLWWLLI